uniref:Uncharacterized protein n=1 Tax=Schlesneria paludicola TaxID=360056 RepID=A0A7C2NVW5_9PLAN
MPAPPRTMPSLAALHEPPQIQTDLRDPIRERFLTGLVSDIRSLADERRPVRRTGSWWPSRRRRPPRGAAAWERR